MKALRLAYLLSFSAGFALMAVEMTAIRALAPAFGTSAFVWAVVIGTVMCLMFAGGLLGGAAADRGLGLERICDVHAMTAVIVIVTSQITLLGLAKFTPSLTGSGFSIAAMLLGSTVVVSCAVVPLASTSPWLIGTLANRAAPAGRVSGRIYAAGTLGGLLGTFVPVLLLVPILGSRWTFAITALVLAVVAAGIRWYLAGAVGRSIAPLAAVVVSLGSLLIPLHQGSQIVDRAESVYNTIRVKDDGVRLDLEVNEGRVIQSRSYHDPQRLPRDVWGLYLTADAFSQTKPTKAVLFLGLGAGSAAIYYHRHFPSYELVGVEIDLRILDMGIRHFGLGEVPIRLENMDARRFLQSTAEQFDIIIADAFVFPYLPAHLSTIEFMTLVRSHLEPGGVALFNVGRYQSHREVVDSITATGLQVFSYGYEYDVDNDMNTLVFLADHPLRAGHPQEGDRRLRQLSRHVGRSLRPVSAPAGMVSTDDRPLSEWLTHRVVMQAFGLL